MIPSSDMVKWLTRELAAKPPEGPVARFELHHASVDDEGTRIGQWHNVEESPFNPGDLGQEICDSAEQDAKSWCADEPQRYVVLCYRTMSVEFETQFPFSVTQRKGKSELGESSEPANEKGALGNALRHGEFLFRAMSQEVGHMSDRTERAEQRAQNAEREAMRALELQQELLDKRAEREAAAKEKQLDLEIKRKLINLIEPFGLLVAPGLARALTSVLSDGKLPERVQLPEAAPRLAPSVDEKTIRDLDVKVRTFLIRLSPEEVNKVASYFDDSARMLFGQVSHQFMYGSSMIQDVETRMMALRSFFTNLDSGSQVGILSSLSEDNKKMLLAIVETFGGADDTNNPQQSQEKH